MGKGVGSTPPISQILFNKTLSENLSKDENQVCVFSVLQIIESGRFSPLEASEWLCALEKSIIF